MSDLAAGTTIRALDWPPSQTASQTTAQTNISSTTYVAPTNACEVTFIAPTSGRVKVIVGAGSRDDTNDNRVFVSPEIRETNVSGQVILSPSLTAHGYGGLTVASTYVHWSRVTIVEGLTPGQQYFARIMIRAETTTSSSADLEQKDLTIIPVP